jgi:hypothetical protein
MECSTLVDHIRDCYDDEWLAYMAPNDRSEVLDGVATDGVPANFCL